VTALVLCYHAVSPDWPEHVNVPPRALAAQVSRLLRRGYRPATFSEAVLAPSHRRTLAVTFDDAYRSVLEHALPALRALGVPATVFAPTRWVGSEEPMPLAAAEWRGTAHERELRCMKWTELAELAAAGWEIGSHTVSHPMLTRLGDDELRAELADSREAVRAALEVPCRSLAYPYGDFDERVAAAAGRAGYEAAGTLYPALVREPAPLEYPRVGISRHHGPRAYALKVSRPVRAARAVPLPDPLLRAVYRLRAVDPPRRPGARPRRPEAGT
jgi:peptidoglycan/xylan/chitin deacetylase (PgdA/CDA1 family)